MAIALICGMTAALLTFVVNAPSAHAAITTKSPLSGITDRNGKPFSGWESVVNNYVVRVTWAELQTAAGGPITPNNKIDQAIAAVHTWNASHPVPEAIKVRIDSGTGAPDWAKNLDGPGTAVAVHDTQDPNTPDSTPDTVGRFWETNFGAAYNDFESKLATLYDGVDVIRDVTISRCTLSTVEPFLRTASSQNTKNNLLAAGYTVAADKACQTAQIDEAKLVWNLTPSSLSFNPYQQINPDGTDNTDESYTESMISYCRTTLGSLCVLENNSLRSTAQGANYTSMYNAIKNAGSPITFQTAGSTVIGSLCNTLTSAVSLGANSVEIPGQYSSDPTITMAGLNAYDHALNRVQPPDNTPPSAPANLTATVNSSSNVTLNWQPATDGSGYGVGCYTVARNGTVLGTTMATTFTDTGANTLNPTQYTVTANDGAGNVGPAVAKSLTPPITSVSSSASTITYGSTVTFTATVTSQDGGTPTGTVNFYDGTTQIGSGTLSNGQAQFATSSLTGGSHSITATYLGDSTFPPSSPSSAITETVNKAASTTALNSSPNPSGYGSTVTITATVSGPGATPTGTVTFKDGSTVLGTANVDGTGQATFQTSGLAIGSHTLSASYAGDGNYNASASATRSQTVTKAGTSTGLNSSANPASYGSPVTLTATVTSPGGIPSGSVTFKSGSTSLGTVTLDSSGTAQVTKTFTKVSTPITATYAGTTTFGGSTSPVFTQTQNNAPPTVTLSSSSSAVTAPSSVTFTASVTSTAGTPSGSVTFYEGSTALAPPVAVVSGKAQLTIALPPGGHVITAAYSGDASFSPKTSAALFQKVNHTGGKMSSAAVTTSPNPSTSGQAVTITATVTGAGATGTVWFFDGGNVIGSANVDGSGHAAFTTSALSVGSHSLKAGYSGDAVFNPSLSNAKTQTVNP